MLGKSHALSGGVGWLAGSALLVAAGRAPTAVAVIAGTAVSTRGERANGAGDQEIVTAPDHRFSGRGADDDDRVVDDGMLDAVSARPAQDS
jgi:hypothetical protein